MNITIRNVPQAVRDEIAARAALEGKSMQEYLLAELEKISTRPSIQAWVNQVRERKRVYGTQAPVSEILKARDADRK